MVLRYWDHLVKMHSRLIHWFTGCRVIRSPGRPALGLMAVLAIGSVAVRSTVFAEGGLEPEARWRSPAALWLAPDGETLLVACEKSGTISLIDTQDLRLVWELPLGKSLVAMAGTRGGQVLVVSDAGADLLLVLDRQGDGLRVRFRIPVPTDPAGVAIDPDDRMCYVTSRWARTLTQVDLAAGKVVKRFDLKFSPRNCIFLADGRTLVVADAFGGNLVLLDTQEHRILRQIDIPGHNIRGMGVSADGKEFLLSQMIVTESAGTTRDNVFWGITMTSNLRVIPVAVLFDAEKNPIREGHTHFFGDPGHAAGDPDALATMADGTMVVCLAGVGEVAVGRYDPYSFQRIGVGRRPRALAISEDQKIAYVANAHSDSISAIDIAEQRLIANVSLGPMPRLSLAEEGERLFYDARLSLDGWFSCHSCHSDGHTNGQNADTLSDGSYGTPKNVLSLLGTGATRPWAWNGSKQTLRDQVLSSMRLTMRPGSPPRPLDSTAIVAYLRTLEPPPPIAPLDERNTATGPIGRGRRLFNELRCTSCHAPPLYTSDFTYSVGLDDEPGGNKLFNPPSLRALAHSAPYFHDARARTLEAVFSEFEHMLPRQLSQTEQQDLLSFLRSL